MKEVDVNWSEIDEHHCIECGADPEHMDYRVDDQNRFVLNCFECETEYIVNVIDDRKDT